jgi:transposase
MKRLAATSTVVAREPHISNAVRAAGEWRPAMGHVGIDVHKRESQVCILTPEGEINEVRIATTRERFRAVPGKRSRARVLVESSTESEWVARCLEELGREVIVAAPGFAPMYGMRTRRVKTDVRDARALAEACRSGVCRLAHRRSEQQRRVTARLVVREALVRSRTSFISVVRALLRQEGLRGFGRGSAWRAPHVRYGT